MLHIMKLLRSSDILCNKLPGSRPDFDVALCGLS